MVNLPLAHDLLWGMTPAQLPADAPAWAIAALAAGQPVVVRRALSEEGLVAVGVRGVLREQRLAAFMPLDSIACRVSPEALCHVECERDLPVMQGLQQLRPMLDDCGWVWGVSLREALEVGCVCCLDGCVAEGLLGTIQHGAEKMLGEVSFGCDCFWITGFVVQIWVLRYRSVSEVG